MRDLTDFLGWLSLTLVCAAAVSSALYSFEDSLEGAHALALGVCVSIAGSSATYLLLSWSRQTLMAFIRITRLAGKGSVPRQPKVVPAPG